MSTAVASIPQALPGSRPQHDASPKATYPTLAPSNNNNHSPSQQPPNERTISGGSATPSAPVVIGEGVAPRKITPDGTETRSPHSTRQPPKIIVKKEPPSSPEVPATARHRPRKLDLSSSNQGSMPSRPSAPLTAREPGSLGMHDVGIACLSPGFKTQDPNMREHIQRSISVRDQQRHIIESRLQKTARPGTENNAERTEINPFGSGLKTPSTSSKKRPPPGLSIVPPSHEQFANERVIQSAPLHQSFTGRHAHPLTRHIQNQPSNLSNTSHIHQTSNRLPPIADVFAGDVAGEGLGSSRELPNTGTRNGFAHQANSQHRPVNGVAGALPSPGLPPPSSGHHPGGANGTSSSRAREYRSAEEAVVDMAGGREDLLPKIVHYRSSHTQQQPPTPPSPGTTHPNNNNGNGATLTPSKLGPHHHPHHPSSAAPSSHHPPPHMSSQPPTLHSQGGNGSGSGLPTHQHATQHTHLNGESHHASSPALTRGFSSNNNNGRRRGRMEYERDAGSPPLGSGPDYPRRMGPFGEGRDSPESQRRRKEEFLGLCARAWDLMHS